MNYKSIILLSLTIGALVLSIWAKLSAPKIAYVNSYQLVEKYEGMKEAREVYMGKIKMWQNKSDSLRSRLEYELQMLDSLKLLPKEKSDLMRQIEHDKLKYHELEQKVAQLTQSEGQTLTEGLLNQINRFVEKYGKEQGYDMIFGTGETGTIIYGKEAINITDQILEGLNKEYKGK